MGKKYKNISMLSHTHGQPASPTTMGKEFINYQKRILNQLDDLKKIKIGKKKIKNNLIDKSLFERSFSEKNLEKILQFRESINELENKQNRGLFLLALISIMEKSSNIRKHGAHYRFINNDNSGVKVKHDPMDVESAFKQKIEDFIKDISLFENLPNFKKSKQNQTYVDDARTFTKIKNFNTHVKKTKINKYILPIGDGFYICWK